MQMDDNANTTQKYEPSNVVIQKIQGIDPATWLLQRVSITHHAAISAILPDMAMTIAMVAIGLPGWCLRHDLPAADDAPSARGALRAHAAIIAVMRRISMKRTL